MTSEEFDDRAPLPRGRHRRIRVVLAVVAAALVVGGLVIGLNHHAGSPQVGTPSFSAKGGPPPSPTVAPSTGGTSTTSSLNPAVSTIEASGSSLVIPSLGVDAPLVPTGATGAVETASLTIPTDVNTVAWWDGTVRQGAHTVQENAPQPGQPGVALIAGHIDSATAGPGALYDLKDLTVGATVQIRDSNGHASSWTVSAPPETALKTELPPALWVTTGPPKLALVTCGGPFDAATGHYRDNVIVWASPTTGATSAGS
jgi:hypothetical protein